MPIHYDNNTQIFHLQAGQSSYAMQVSNEGYLCHLYYGKRISQDDLSYLNETGRGASFAPNPADGSPTLDTRLQEFPGAGVGDFRVPAVGVRAANGAYAVELKVVSHAILTGEKPALPGLPAFYLNDANEADTLEITMEDALLGLRVKLYYTAFAGENVITRWAVAENHGTAPLSIENLQSACVDFPRMDLDMVSLHGAWNRERHVERHPLFHGSTVIASRRGSSSHQLNPFAVLCDKHATEHSGSAYGVQLVYSGNFKIEAEVNQMHCTRVTVGINPENFAWRLQPGESFTTPEAVLSYSDEGFGGLSRALHRVTRNNLVRGEWKHKLRPIKINSWEAAYFNFDADKLVAFAREAAKTDVDLLVMDDGWFGLRNDDTTSLGDWFVNEEKLGCSLKELAERVNAEGLDFGIWFEPEMISPDSELYRKHPDWALHIPERGRSLGRRQCVINMALPEVQDYLFDSMSAVLKQANITYLKWDFNRNLTEVFCNSLPANQQGEVGHRFYLGLYDLCERLVQAFPHILFESCSGGGGRFDLGMLYYMPQTWTSDNTDPVDRLKIQWGTSMAYPIMTMGAHVAAPYHGRAGKIGYRAAVATTGAFGYELDPTKLTDEQIAEMRECNAEFRRHQQLVSTGDFYRLVSPYDNDGHYTAWQFVSPDKSETLIQCFTVFNLHNVWDLRVYPQGLDADAQYELDCGAVLHGDTIMHAGLRLQHFGGDFSHRLLFLKKKPPAAEADASQ
ncbi:MAG: alpha-galactosidase [Oscillospiraceae bacterium]|nr:alpha-galactosidase [Oscillospiraceae bacterium]